MVIPEVVPLFYQGQKVLSTPQLAVFFKCKRQNVNDNFKNHKEEFVENVDYFFLKSEEFRAFKQDLKANGYIQPQANGYIQPQMQANGYIQPQANGYIQPPFANGATNVYLWTESGVAKLAKFIGTDEAKLIYSSLVFGYFQKKQPEPPANSPHFVTPKIKKSKPKEALTFEQLLKLIEHCTNNNLRDELIQRAAGRIEKPKCVYVIEFSDGTVKIGITQNFLQRARQLNKETCLEIKKWCHSDYLIIEEAQELESALLEQFAELKIAGEFFKVEYESAMTELMKRVEIAESKEII